MISRRDLLQHFCPTCNTEFRLLPEVAGEVLPCPICKNSFRVPGQAPVPSPDASNNTGLPLTAEETAEFYNSPAGRAYLARKAPIANGSLARRTRQAAFVRDAYEPMPDARHPVTRQDNGNKIKIWFLKWFGFETVVDRKTSNAMATTALGGVLVALGAVVMARLGMKPKA